MKIETCSANLNLISNLVNAHVVVVIVDTVERIPEPGGAVHELRLRADGSVSRDAGSRGRTQRRRRQREHQGPACSA